MPTQSSYPTEIADAICKRWSSLNCDASLLPDAQHVVQLVDIMYQASLLREESEIILCRTMVCQPSDFAEELQHGASGVQVLRFAEPCLLSPNQVRKLAAAAGYFRSMLAVHFDQADRAVIWGIISTGTDWINRADVASERDGDLPDNLVIHCLGPGHLIASCGDARVLESANGKLLTEGFDPFRSKWLPQRFGSVRNAMLKWIESHTAGSLANQTKMCDDFVRDLAQSVVRRTLRLVRTRGHGGMLIYLPDSIISSDKLETWMRFRVHFEPDHQRTVSNKSCSKSSLEPMLWDTPSSCARCVTEIIDP